MTRETIAGVPPHLSRDYPSFPIVDSSWNWSCEKCRIDFIAYWRRLPCGRIHAPVLCDFCREKERALWIAGTALVLPVARVRPPGWLRKLFSRGR